MLWYAAFKVNDRFATGTILLSGVMLNLPNDAVDYMDAFEELIFF